MKLVVDSNIFISFISSLDPNDIFHSECYPLFERILAFEIEALCPALVLVETTCVIRRRTKSKGVASLVYKNLSALPGINWFDMTLAVAERACLIGAETGLRGGDAIVLQLAQEFEVPLLTKDKELRYKAPAGVSVIEPSEVPA